MEDVRQPQSQPPGFGKLPWRGWGHSLCLGACIFGLAGCSMFVLAGKMFFGDPKQTSAFHEGTGVDLTEGKKKVVVLCSAPA